MTTMAVQNLVPLLVLIILRVFVKSSESVSPDNFSPTFPRRFLPYQGVRAAYWPSSIDFPASSIDTRYFTHIYYAFLHPEPDTYKLSVTEFDQTNIPEFINGLRYKHPQVKTLFSIGGGGNEPTVFATMAKNQRTRGVFINSTIQVARQYGFDGIDLDWEFPANKQDMANLALLYREWYEALVLDARIHRKPRLLLTSAVYYASRMLFLGDEPRSYPAEAIRKYLDWVSPMCFDYHGSWDNFTGVNAALYDPKSNISTYYGIGSWIQAGVPPEKLVMGLPLYGRTWELRDPNVHGIGAPAVGVGPGNEGTMNYKDVIEFNQKNNAKVVYDVVSVSYYSYVGDSWITYDDVWSIQKKVQFARSRALRGYFFWAVDKDKDWTISRQASNAWGH
ncbi:hypothetical protein L6164_015702 [Bauhinia variegata]|uniref:Uncharacterized protein n=1 Tax=Bauhinia variegata TaxID=167791 RepID=A0ACB9NMG4_BAUVA|nr:hypothetical protein L6164_015702 [Bauhinia variegata]